MAHILRKYISNRGSALFMVISTMTALIISCMAMYFTMVSANSAQYAVFGQMQATQTAVSLKDIVLKSFAPDNDSTGGNVLLEKMLKLDEGDCITTDANGFMALDPNKETGKNQTEIGAYSVTITCLAKDPATGYMKFDILAMSSFDGSRDAVHVTYDYNPNNPAGPVGNGSGGDMELFAATGYVPNDAYINGGYYLTNVFYDTQYTYMNTYGGSGENRIGQDLYTGGNLMLGSDAMSVVHSASNDAISSADVDKIGPITWAIRGNFYPNLNSDMGMRGGSRILVGGNFVHNCGNNLFYVKNGTYDGETDDHICIYVNGDFDYSGSDIKKDTWVFVNGNVYNIGNNKQDNVRLFVTGTETERQEKTKTISQNLKNNLTVEEWAKDKWPDNMWPKDDDGNYIKTPPLTFTEAMGKVNGPKGLINEKTQTIAYYKWDLSGNTKGSGTQHVDVRINATNSDWTDDKGDTYAANARNFIFAYPDSESEKLVNDGSETGVVGKTFIIDSVMVHDDNDRGKNIIIDTGDNPDNIMTIKLGDVTGHGEFSWFVDESGNTFTGRPNSYKRLVILKGRGTVLFDIPDGIIYQDASCQVTAHVGWFLIEGGKIGTKDGHLDFSGIDPQGKYAAKIVPYIHKTCNGYYETEKDESGFDASKYDGCEFTTATSEIKCQECMETNLTQVTCSVHGDVNKYCSKCHPEKETRTDWCINHVDKLAFDEFYDTLSGTEKEWVTDSEGIVYPTTNIMLVSCDESAEIRFSHTTKDENIVNNEFFGFIYAPYMSYLAAKGAQAGGLIKLCGGMTVGDYDIQAIHAYIGCYPDKMPTELAGMDGGGVMAGNKLEGAAKSWKISIGGYT